MLNDEATAVTWVVVQALESLDIPYLIGGSFASAVHGFYRATADADLLADLTLAHVGPLVEALRGEFYVDAESIREAVYHRRSFNVIHLETGFKVDVFVPRGRPFDRMQLQRRSLQQISPGGDRTAYFATAEDIVLSKLEWYRLGDEVSDRQWLDILGVLKVQGAGLDLAYLRRWASELGVALLLARALSQAGVSA